MWFWSVFWSTNCPVFFLFFLVDQTKNCPVSGNFWSVSGNFWSTKFLFGIPKLFLVDQIFFWSTKNSQRLTKNSLKLDNFVLVNQKMRNRLDNWSTGQKYTANVYRELQGLYREIGVQSSREWPKSKAIVFQYLGFNFCHQNFRLNNWLSMLLINLNMQGLRKTHFWLKQFKLDLIKCLHDSESANKKRLRTQ